MPSPAPQAAASAARFSRKLHPNIQPGKDRRPVSMCNVPYLTGTWKLAAPGKVNRMHREPATTGNAPSGMGTPGTRYAEVGGHATASAAGGSRGIFGVVPGPAGKRYQTGQIRLATPANHAGVRGDGDPGLLRLHPEDYGKSVGLLEEKRVALTPLVTHRLPLAEGIGAIERLTKGMSAQRVLLAVS